MTATLLDRLVRRLRALPVDVSDNTSFVVGLSGGVDSVTLLAALQRSGIARQLRCIHIDHQLHPDSAQWTDFCREYAQRLGVDIVCRTVRCVRAHGGTEAAARAARYAAFAEELQDAEILLTAHHADDQLETLLYRLVRGTGVDGLRGIREFEAFGRGWLARPLLSETRAAIKALAQELDLPWCEDPSNVDTSFDRNYLRQRVLPQLLERWPEAGAAAGRLAAAASDSAELAQALAAADLEGINALDCLPIGRIASLSAARQRNVLRHAVRELALPTPDAAALQRLCALLQGRSATGVVEWPGAEAHLFNGALYLRSARSAATTTGSALSAEHACPVAEGSLRLARGGAPALPDRWVRDGLTVRYRHGGERFQPAGSARPVALREWMRQEQLLPWMRDRVPLLYRGEDLVAVADLGVSESAAEAAGPAGGWRVTWEDRPRTN